MTKINRDVTVNAVEFRRNAGQAIRFFTTLRDAALDVGRGRSEATIAAAAAVRRLFPDIDLLAALGLGAEAAQGAAGRAAGGDDGQSDGEQPEAGEGRHGGALPPRSRDPRRLFVDLIDAELGPDLNDEIDRLAEFWDREPDAEREAGDGEFIDDDSLRAAGVSLHFAHDFAKAMAREERFTAAGWTDNPERDPTHGEARIAMLSPGFIEAANEHVDLMLAAGYGAGTSRPGRALRMTTSPGIAAAITLKLDRGPDGVFRVPGTPARRGLRVA